jgi:hypothetical protein
MLIWVLMAANALAKPNDTIVIANDRYFIDQKRQLIITNVNVAWVNDQWKRTKTHIRMGDKYAFSSPVAQVEIGKAYSIAQSAQDSVFTLYFTQLPIIHITTKFKIKDQPSVLANFKMVESAANTKITESYIGIQYRGNWSQTLPKKSMEIQFWKDTKGDEKQNFALLGMRNDDSWNLQAMYNEPLRLRSKTNNELWQLLHRPLGYQKKEPQAINGIRMNYIELFMNNEYRGLYCLAEKVDGKQLKLKKYDENGIRGELYKADSKGQIRAFRDLPPYNNQLLEWGGFEYKYPKEKTDWSNLHRLMDLVINAPDSIFYQQYAKHFEMNNAVDYYIFLNLLRLIDNRDRNLYLAKYDQQHPYFYVPWDLDGSFGASPQGAKDPHTIGLISNGFFKRAFKDKNPNEFYENLAKRWAVLRASILTPEAVMAMFKKNHDFLLQNGVYERERLAWPEYKYEPEDQFAYTLDWITARISYLDSQFVLK